jgi:predicted amidohydrolase
MGVSPSTYVPRMRSRDPPIWMRAARPSSGGSPSSGAASRGVPASISARSHLRMRRVTDRLTAATETDKLPRPIGHYALHGQHPHRTGKPAHTGPMCQRRFRTQCFSSTLGLRWASRRRPQNIAVILGTERVTDGGLQISAAVFTPDGTFAGWQDKCQLDPSEEALYPALGSERRLFTVGPLTFGIVICHEGWRYPETVRWAAPARRPRWCFHPHRHLAEPGSPIPSGFADPQNSFHEKAMLCRAAENTCYFASVNCASADSGYHLRGGEPRRIAALLPALRRRRLAHRGPDSRCRHLQFGVALSHVRLTSSL